jgi:hypothetical protein
MLSINECRKLLGSSNKKFSDEELKVAMEFIQQLAEITVNDIKRKYDEESSSNGSRFKR